MKYLIFLFMLPTAGHAESLKALQMEQCNLYGQLAEKLMDLRDQGITQRRILGFFEDSATPEFRNILAMAYTTDMGPQRFRNTVENLCFEEIE